MLKPCQRLKQLRVWVIFSLYGFLACSSLTLTSQVELRPTFEQHSRIRLIHDVGYSLLDWHCTLFALQISRPRHEDGRKVSHLFKTWGYELYSYFSYKSDVHTNLHASRLIPHDTSHKHTHRVTLLNKTNRKKSPSNIFCGTCCSLFISSCTIFTLS